MMELPVTKMSRIVMPASTNDAGNLYGGRLLRSFNRKQVRPHETRRQLYFDRGNTGENKRNQGKEGNGLKTGQKLPPFPFIIFIKERW